jgi:hypothetical protein
MFKIPLVFKALFPLLPVYGFYRGIENHKYINECKSRYYLYKLEAVEKEIRNYNQNIYNTDFLKDAQKRKADLELKMKNNTEIFYYRKFFSGLGGSLYYTSPFIITNIPQEIYRVEVFIRGLESHKNTGKYRAIRGFGKIFFDSYKAHMYCNKNIK